MKHRSDFVTNSSSSSFVISFKDVGFDKELKDSNPMFVHIENIVKKYFMQDTGYESPYLFNDEDDEDSVMSWVRERYGSYSDSSEELFSRINQAKEMYDKIMEELRSGNKVVIKSVTYEDDDLSELLYQLERAGKIKIIEVEED